MENINDSLENESRKAKEQMPMSMVQKMLTLILPYILTGILTPILHAMLPIQFPIFISFPLTIIILYIGYAFIINKGYKTIAKDYRNWIFTSYLTMVGLFALEFLLAKMR